MALTAAQRAEWVNGLRARPNFMSTLTAAVERLHTGRTYTVDTFKNARQRTVTGVLTKVADGVLFMVDDTGRKNRMVVADITRITVHEVSDGR